MVRFVPPLHLIVAVSAFVAQSVEADQVQGEPSSYARLPDVSLQSQLRGAEGAKDDGLWQSMHIDDLDHLDDHQTTEDGRQLSDGTGGDGSQEVTCSCTGPSLGTLHYNEYTCTDGTKASCASDQTCYATVPFVKGDWPAGCQVMCSCTTPNAGAVHHNQYKCTDGDGGYCATDETCYAIGPFVKGDSQKSCQVPTPTPPYLECKKVCATNIVVGYDGTQWCVSSDVYSPIPLGEVWVDPQTEPQTKNGCCSFAAGHCAHCCKPRETSCLAVSVEDRCKGTSKNGIPEGEQWLAMYSIKLQGAPTTFCCSK